MHTYNHWNLCATAYIERCVLINQWEDSKQNEDNYSYVKLIIYEHIQLLYIFHKDIINFHFFIYFVNFFLFYIFCVTVFIIINTSHCQQIMLSHLLISLRSETQQVTYTNTHISVNYTRFFFVSSLYSKQFYCYRKS